MYRNSSGYQSFDRHPYSPPSSSKVSYPSSQLLSKDSFQTMYIYAFSKRPASTSLPATMESKSTVPSSLVPTLESV